MKLLLELPEGTMCVFANYVYATPDGMLMQTTSIDGDALYGGIVICKGARGDEESHTEI